MSKPIKQSELEALKDAAAELAESWREGPAMRQGVAHERFLRALDAAGVVPRVWRSQFWGVQSA